MMKEAVDACIEDNLESNNPILNSLKILFALLKCFAQDVNSLIPNFVTLAFTEILKEKLISERKKRTWFQTV
jgi:hypothetical protein